MTFTKYILTISCAFASQLVFGQISPTLADSSNQMSITGDAGIYSNGLPLELSNKFLYGGVINTSIKDNASTKLNGNNQLAVEALGRLSYLSKSKTIFGVKNAFWGVEIGSQIISYSTYSDDLFKLVFYGNEPYAGQNLNLAKSFSKTVSFHNIGITGGVTLKNVGSFDKLHISATPSFVLGVLQQDFNLTTGDLLTETDGEYIQLDFKGNYTSSDSITDAFSPKGHGAKIDLSFVLESKKNKIGLSVSDLGLIAWNNKINYNLDTNFTFSGLQIDDIFDVQDTLITAAEIQDSTFVNSPNKSTLSLPVLIGAYFEHSFTDHLILKNWARYRLVDGYLPFVMTQINYTTSGFTGGLSAAFGGYSGLQAGLNLGYDLGIFDITVGTTNLLAFIGQKNQYSQNVYGKITYKY
jgi:hypothetical protein